MDGRAGDHGDNIEGSRERRDAAERNERARGGGRLG